MPDFSVGDKVSHIDHGEGQVLKKRTGDRIVVAFDLKPSLPLNVLKDDLTSVELENTEEATSGAPGLTLVPADETPSQRSLRHLRGSRQRLSQRASTVDDEKSKQIDAFQILEALRLGVVPQHGVDAYTVGRETEIASVSALLDATQGCRVIWGDYGTGKTHLLDVSEQLARRAGFATARITLDPTENALSHPLRLYRRIAESIHMPGAASGGLDSILDDLTDNEAFNSADGACFSRFFSSYLFVLNHGNDEDIGWFRDYVHADKIDSEELRKILRRLRWRGEMPLTLSDFRTYGRMYTHMIGTLAAWTKGAGANGLVLLFDEVERIDALSHSQQGYALEVLKHFSAVTMAEDDLLFSAENELYRGGHSVHKSLSLKFQEDQPLCVVFALTPLPEIEAHFGEITESDNYDVALRPLKKRDMVELARRIGDIYEVSYPEFKVAPFLEELVEICGEGLDAHDANFRAAVRSCVYLMDERRLGIES